MGPDANAACQRSLDSGRHRGIIANMAAAGQVRRRQKRHQLGIVASTSRTGKLTEIGREIDLAHQGRTLDLIGQSYRDRPRFRLQRG
jgi:hypothetical protein